MKDPIDPLEKVANAGCDWLVMAAHPDDAELGMGGTMLKAVAQGLRVVVVDWTRGELGTRGTAELRMHEAAMAAKKIGLADRAQLDLGDGYFEENRELLHRLIEVIRRYRPKVIWGNAVSDRHPDHGRASGILRRAVFMSALPKVQTEWNGKNQDPWRVSLLGFYIQDHYHKPDLVVDITPFAQDKEELLRCFGSQFHKEGSSELMTPIARPDFLPFVEARSREMGRWIGVEFGEGFLLDRPCSVTDLGLLV
ncbi:MAG: bacillithiol biosynthesis deacetylase BshB1 [Sphingomonadales bacterium]|nr:bacillithiol biosynthesis deacetylase BshB1 [Sphingomonadales bacterium]MBM3923250.1 bacillithiol biosynthesis deacetylase BshB1 [Sphingomonadales bacterium]MBM3931627.1 bacillithiol biosynthesis deacetylase BshB1 [Sphingomonadales bacterium]